MWKLLKKLIKEEDGLGTVEIVIIVAILVGIALIFRGVIIEFVKSILKSIFSGKEQFTPSQSEASKVINDITGNN